MQKTSDDEDEEPRFVNYDPPAAFEPYCVKKPNQPKAPVIEPKKVEQKPVDQMKFMAAQDQPFREELCLPPSKPPTPLPVVLETIVEEKPKSQDQVNDEKIDWAEEHLYCMFC